MVDAAARGVGPGRLLQFGYGVLTVAAGARSLVQLATDAARAPFAYWLSLGAAATYAVGFVLVRAVDTAPTARRRQYARTACAGELAAVLTVGAITTVSPRLFADETVWSWFGAGYLFVPLALPVLALRWLGRPSA